MDLTVFSLPRTGSTVAWQIAKCLTGKHPQKSHSFPSNDFKDLGIITIRNPFYSALSEERIGSASLAEASIKILEWSVLFNSTSFGNNFILLKYEDYIDDPLKRIYDISDFMNVSLSKEKALEILNKTSVSSNLKEANKFETFEHWDAESYIHGEHISDPYNTQEFNIKDLNIIANLKRAEFLLGYK